MGELGTHIFIDLPPNTAYWRGVIEGVASYCRAHPSARYSLPSGGEPLVEGPERADGVITIVPDAAAAERAWRFGKPVVNVSSIGRDLGFPSVLTDNPAIGGMAADHLLGLGYAAYAYHMDGRVRYSNERLEGFRARLGSAARGVEVFDTSPERGAPEASSELRAATATWIKALPKPLGLLAHNDARASGILAILHDAGIRVPEEVGILGVDDDAFLDESCRPTLSSVDNAPSVVGFRAAEMLVGLLGGARPSTVLVAPRRVVQRQSTQPVLTDDPLLMRAVLIIRQRACEPIGIAQVLQEVPLSRRSLERVFRLRLGRSPAEEILRVRMDRARSLLAETELTIAAIAESVGYNQGRNFATAFRRECAMEPRAYRALYRMRQRI